MDSISLLVYSARQAVAVKNFTHNTVLLCSAVAELCEKLCSDVSERRLSRPVGTFKSYKSPEMLI
ncbi:MAG: hypothetical protein GX452_09505 [Ignavibacteriales bacterium]|nr:hypothetical protein [Ignavibacteriaceae bacterium]NLH61626.1 hypothetical protein [Ignavibacteriales bacterium]